MRSVSRDFSALLMRMCRMMARNNAWCCQSEGASQSRTYVASSSSGARETEAGLEAGAVSAALLWLARGRGLFVRQVTELGTYSVDRR